MEKYGRARQVTDDNITRRMRTACRTTKARHRRTVIIFDTYCQQQYEIFCSSAAVLHFRGNTGHLYTSTVDSYIYTNNNNEGKYFCFRKETMVTRTRHNVTLYVHWLSFFKHSSEWYSVTADRSGSGLRRRSAASSLLGLWVRIPPRAWISVCCECCVLSGRGLCDELITRPEESYRVRCV